MAVADADIAHAEVTIRGQLANAVAGARPFANVFHYRRTAFAIPASKTSLATAFDTAIIQTYLDAAADAVTAVTVGVRWLSDPLDVEVQQAANPNTAGQVATDSLPNQNAVSMLLRTNQRGRSKRGAKRWAGVPEAHTTRDVLTGGGLTLWQAVQTALLAQVTDGDGNVWALEIVSRKFSVLTNSPATVSAADVNAVLLNKNIGSQDTRRPPTVR